MLVRNGKRKTAETYCTQTSTSLRFERRHFITNSHLLGPLALLLFISIIATLICLLERLCGRYFEARWAMLRTRSLEVLIR